jgi:hypothetical protein
VVSWLDTCPADTSRAATLTLALETDNNDLIPTHRPRRDRRLPARYRTGDYITSDSARLPIPP